MKDKQIDSVPTQKTGNELSVEHTVHAVSQEAAKLLYDIAVARMLHVNQWHLLTGSLFSVFQLTDNKGHDINRDQVIVNDYFKINIPAPGTQAGDGYDWVQVEMIDYHTDTKTSADSVTMRVRPVANPADPDAGTAHFFEDSATSTFKVYRNGLSITAAVYGRNESANTAGNVMDSIRNAAVAMGAILGGSHLQWQSLVKGILSTDEPEA